MRESFILGYITATFLNGIIFYILLSICFRKGDGKK